MTTNVNANEREYTNEDYEKMLTALENDFPSKKPLENVKASRH